MLVLTRRVNEKIVISTDIFVTVLNVDGDQVKLGIDAPGDISIHRQEVFNDIMRSNREALLEGEDRRDAFLSILKRKNEHREE
ncbi:MAG: carbon storage regulator CsrA [Candidatus Latescibacteria bacterium]|nr:carbon storage regulator CsrA [bacterium]MBD3425254.1 carbon storage regulator CsrA [Candidatus Latescibacterota bacterium]